MPFLDGLSANPGLFADEIPFPAGSSANPGLFADEIPFQAVSSANPGLFDDEMPVSDGFDCQFSIASFGLPELPAVLGYKNGRFRS